MALAQGALTYSEDLLEERNGVRGASLHEMGDRRVMAHGEGRGVVGAEPVLVLEVGLLEQRKGLVRIPDGQAPVADVDATGIGTAPVLRGHVPLLGSAEANSPLQISGRPESESEGDPKGAGDAVLLAVRTLHGGQDLAEQGDGPVRLTRFPVRACQVAPHEEGVWVLLAQDAFHVADDALEERNGPGRVLACHTNCRQLAPRHEGEVMVFAEESAARAEVLREQAHRFRVIARHQTCAGPGVARGESAEVLVARGSVDACAGRVVRSGQGEGLVRVARGTVGVGQVVAAGEGEGMLRPRHAVRIVERPLVQRDSLFHVSRGLAGVRQVVAAGERVNVVRAELSLVVGEYSAEVRGGPGGEALAAEEHAGVVEEPRRSAGILGLGRVFGDGVPMRKQGAPGGPGAGVSFQSIGRTAASSTAVARVRAAVTRPGVRCGSSPSGARATDWTSRCTERARAAGSTVIMLYA
nr:hypothetical protein [Streptomyces sp. SKN60]